MKGYEPVKIIENLLALRQFNSCAFVKFLHGSTE